MKFDGRDIGEVSPWDMELARQMCEQFGAEWAPEDSFQELKRKMAIAHGQRYGIKVNAAGQIE
ncbi:MAG TPA: hypothetical protein VMQ60_01605 [Acidobacteriaceae bacterium]|jgi:hypothetical protein|nr:hypothetical protein [Acidobacteriaceae bacterium]